MKRSFDPWQEYDAAAMDLARKGLTGKIGDPLPNLMSTETCKLINADPEAFERRVRQSATCIDWERAARELQADYSTVEFAGQDYLVRD